MGQERGLVMLCHSVIIAVVLYLVLLYGLKWSAMKSENMSVLVGGLVVSYMVLFGHGLPTKINSNLF